MFTKIKSYAKMSGEQAAMSAHVTPGYVLFHIPTLTDRVQLLALVMTNLSGNEHDLFNSGQLHS